jgi:hypothetical protein
MRAIETTVWMATMWHAASSFMMKPFNNITVKVQNKQSKLPIFGQASFDSDRWLVESLESGDIFMVSFLFLYSLRL